MVRPGATGKGRLLRSLRLTSPVFVVTAVRSPVLRSTKVRPRTTVDPWPFLTVDRPMLRKASRQELEAGGFPRIQGHLGYTD